MTALTLALARLEHAWDDVPPPIQLRLIGAIAAVADEYAPPTRRPRPRVPLVGRLGVSGGQQRPVTGLGAMPRPVRYGAEGAMLSGRSFVEVLTTLRAAERLLRRDADRLARLDPAAAAPGEELPSERAREMLEVADDLAVLAEQVAAEAEAG